MSPGSQGTVARKFAKNEKSETNSQLYTMSLAKPFDKLTSSKSTTNFIMQLDHYLFNIKDQKISFRTCVCHVPHCKTLVELYRSIHDVRGRYSTFPSMMSASDTRTSLRDGQQFRFDRSTDKLVLAEAAMVACRDSRERVSSPITRYLARTVSFDGKRIFWI